MFAGNYAGHSGGAVGIIMTPLVSCRGQIGSFESVSIVNKRRMALWDGVTYLVNNTVYYYGDFSVSPRCLMLREMGRRRLSALRPAMSRERYNLPGSLVLLGMTGRP